MPLANIIKATELSVSKKRTPVIIFDLDDTLIDTRYRKLAILKELSEENLPQSEFHSLCEILKTASIQHVKYLVKDTLNALGIFHDEFITYTENYWKQKNFSSPYVLLDKPIQGASRYVNWLHRKGGKIIYLTGRDRENMGSGTLQNLKDLDFPVQDISNIVMKEDTSVSDADFKKVAIQSLVNQGEVIALFENEGRNLIEMAEYCPNSNLVILDTLQSPNQPFLPPDVHVIKNFV